LTDVLRGLFARPFRIVVALTVEESVPLEPLEHWARRAAELHRRHRRLVNASVIAALAGFSALAFGIAPLAPDAADLPRRMVIEEVATEDLSAQSEALASFDLALSRADLTRSTDSAETLLARLGVVDDGAASFLRKDPTARRVLQGRAGKMVQVQTSDGGQLMRLVARYPAERSEQAGTHFTRLTMERVAGQWMARLDNAALQPQVRLGSGTVRSSLFAAADEARIPDGISAQLAEVFSNDIDFQRELRSGDTFSVVYEALTADGEPITWNEGAGRVLAAEFVNAGERYQAVWFPTANGKGAYFAPDGTSKQRSFLSSPMAFSRVTSGFAMRFHPLLHAWRAHKGVDYGAPTGTAIRTVGDGVVSFSGWQNGYGNAVEVRHSNGRSTFYAHMSRVDVRAGQRVDQGQTIGAVGATGWATGPHLHFEFRVNGGVQDPLKIARASEAVTLPADQLPAFRAAAARFGSQLAIAESLLGARAEAE
jgi:murein DD-endopeptidase MepM/ murein hydrolase activator NlpD